jgi:hypothetical protein
MRPTRAAITLPITSFATLLAFVACGPTKDYVTVQQQPRSALSKAIESCQSGIKPSLKRVEKDKSVKLCRINPEAGADRTKESKPELLDEPYFYEVSKLSEQGREQIKITVPIGVTLPDSTSEKTRSTVIQQLQHVCGSSIRKVFGRSLRANLLALELDYKLVNKTDDLNGSQEAMNQLDLVQVGSDAVYPVFEMQAFSGGARFFVSGDPREESRCKSISGTADDKKNCRRLAYKASNLKFCRQLTKMTGAWLGLSDIATEAKACGVKPEAAAASDANAGTETPAADNTNEAANEGAKAEIAKPVAPRESKFMKAASEEDPKAFFENAKLEIPDLVTILSPACSAFTNLVSPAPTATATPTPGAPVPSASPAPTAAP